MQTINFCFGSTVLSFCFSFGQILGLFALFGLFGAIFGVGVRFKNFFGTCLHRLTTFILEVQLYLASLKLSRVAGWLGGWGWLVGESDFNENPVVSLDLDLDFGLRLRVCQYFNPIINLFLFSFNGRIKLHSICRFPLVLEEII